MTIRLLFLVGFALLLLSYLPTTQGVPPQRPFETEVPTKEPSWIPSDTTPGFPSLSPSEVPFLQPSISPSILPLVVPITVAIEILGQSGKFTVFDEEVGNNDPDRVTVALDFLYEIGTDGVSKVGNTGNPKHSIQSFASQDFSIDEPIDTMLGSEVNPVGAQLISFRSSINGIGLITLDTYIIKSGGTIETDDGESWDIQTNDVKFNIVLSDWTFCDPCGTGNNQASSEFIDVAVEIKGRGGAPEPQGDLLYNLGGDVPLLLSNRVNVDGEWVKMPDGYPSVESQGNKSLFVFRFPKFSDKAIYDPIIGMGALNTTLIPSDSTTGSPSLSPSDVPFLQPSISPSILPLVVPITVAIEILGQSGKFTVFDEEVGNNDPDRVTVALDFLYEIGTDGVSKVGNTGNPKHSIQSFASQDFSIDEPIDTMLEVNGMVDPVGAQLISFRSSVNGIGLITLDTYIIKSGGTIETDDGESWDIQTNDVKFNIVLSDWTFCDPCGTGNNQASSEFIDVAVEIKGRGGAPETQGGLLYNLGGDVPLLLSNRVNVDGEWVKMPDGYPSVESQGNKSLFVFRFPKFSDKAIYDPIIGLGALNTTHSPTTVLGSEEPTFSPPPTISTAAPVTLPTPRPTDTSNTVVPAANNGLYVVSTVVVWWLIT